MFVGEVVGVAAEGVNGGEVGAEVVGDEAAEDREVFVTGAGEAMSVGGGGVRGRVGRVGGLWVGWRGGGAHGQNRSGTEASVAGRDSERKPTVIPRGGVCEAAAVGRVVRCGRGGDS